MKYTSKNYKESALQHEKEGRTIVVYLFDLLFNESNYDSYDLYNRYDLTFTASTNNVQNKMYLVEVKTRDCPYNLYDNCFLELGKKEALCNSDKPDHTPLYIAVYPDKVCVWNLEKIDFEKLPISHIKMKKCTDCPNQERILKPVYEMPFNLAKKYVIKKEKNAVHIQIPEKEKDIQ